jgi:predicted MFS family arabinose efflux permease
LRDRRPAGRVEPSRGFFAALAQKDLLPVWFVGSVFATASTAYFTFLKTLVMEIGTGSVGGFFTTFTAAALVLRLFFPWVPDRFGKKRVLRPALALIVISLMVLAFSSRNIEILVAGFLAGLGHGFGFPILISLAVDRARPAERGAAMSIFTALFDAGVLIGGPTFGAVIHLAGYGVMFASAAAMLAAGSLVFFLWDRPAQR